jgi:hypothetical protein
MGPKPLQEQEDTQFNVDKYRISRSETTVRRVSERKAPYNKLPGEFLRGPVPLYWLRRAAELPGKTLAVGVTLWFKAGVTKNNQVKASSGMYQKLGIHRKAVYRGINNLEMAGLVTVVRHIGRAPLVTIINDWEASEKL